MPLPTAHIVSPTYRTHERDRAASARMAECAYITRLSFHRHVYSARAHTGPTTTIEQCGRALAGNLATHARYVHSRLFVELAIVPLRGASPDGVVVPVQTDRQTRRTRALSRHKAMLLSWKRLVGWFQHGRDNCTAQDQKQ